VRCFYANCHKSTVIPADDDKIDSRYFDDTIYRIPLFYVISLTDSIQFDSIRFNLFRFISYILGVE